MRREVIISAILLACFVCYAANSHAPPVSSVASKKDHGRSWLSDDIATTTLSKGFMGSQYPVGVTYRLMKTTKGQVVHSFLGVQYGKDPSKTRFKRVDLYTLPGSTLNATMYGKKCPQMKELQFDIESSENCLTLNVYTLKAPGGNTTGTIPVMVFSIVGGALHAEASMYKPSILLDYNNVIIVTIQYRLGALGFFTMNNKDVPGNAALSDLIQALLWVQRNIGYLGGDKNRVTIVGHGQGAQLFSTLLFYRSIPKVTPPLFHAAILQSGSALGRLAVDASPDASGFQIAQANYCANATMKDPAKILSCMQGKAVQEITINLDLFLRSERQSGRPGVVGTIPSLQTGTTIPASDKLLTDSPENIAKDTSKLVDVPVMIGVNKNEGSYFFGGIYWTLLKDKYERESYLRNEMLPDILKMTGIPEPTKDLAEMLRNDYVGDGDIAALNSSSPGLIDLTGGLFVKNEAWRTAQLMASVNKSFFYAFDFESKDSLFDTYFQYMKPKAVFEHGVTHGDELMYLFDMPGDLVLDKSQLKTRDRLATLWTNFAVYHDPTPDENKKSWDKLSIPKWEPLNENKNYLLIEGDCKIANDYMKRRHIAHQPNPLPTQEEYDFVNQQRQSFMVCMIIFLLSTVALGGFIVYDKCFKK